MFVNLHHQSGIEALQNGDLDGALELLNKALQDFPCHPDILSDRGFLYIHLGQNALAIEDFDLSLDLQPAYSYRYASRGYARAHFGDLEGAIEDYRKAIELDKNDAISHNNLGILLQQTGDNEQAEFHFEVADRLSEEQFFQIMEDVEGEQKSLDRVVIPPSDLIRKQENAMHEMKHLFTSKEKFMEFMHFLKNGFKNQ